MSGAPWVADDRTQSFGFKLVRRPKQLQHKLGSFNQNSWRQVLKLALKLRTKEPILPIDFENPP
jgi:hypothetical protein